MENDTNWKQCIRIHLTFCMHNPGNAGVVTLKSVLLYNVRRIFSSEYTLAVIHWSLSILVQTTLKWYLIFSQRWFFIMSKLGKNLVMDVAFCRTTSGTQVISYTKKNHPRPNQLWRKEHVGENAFYLVSKLHPSCKITIKVINFCCHLYSFCS